MSYIIEQLINQMNHSATDQIAKRLGVSEDVAKMAVTAGLPMLLGALGRNASDPQEAQALSQALERDHDGAILNNVREALSDPKQLEAGSAILKHVLGSKQNNVRNALGQAVGMDSNQVNDVLSLLAPLVLGQLGKTKREQGLDANDLAGILQGERKTADQQLGGMASLLDMDGDGDITDDVVNLGKRLLGGFLR